MPTAPAPDPAAQPTTSGGTQTGSGGGPVTGGGNATGGDLQSLYNAYYGHGMSEYPAQNMGTDPSYLAGLLGVSQEELQSGYLDYVFAPNTPVPPLSIEQWASSQVRNVEGYWSPIVDAFAQQWEAANNQLMPGELRQQLLQAMKSMTPAEQAQAETALYGYLSAAHQWSSATNDAGRAGAQQEMQKAIGGVVQGLPFLQAIEQHYAEAHPQQSTADALKATAAQNFISQYYGITGQMPSQDLIDQYTSTPGAEQAAFLNNVRLPNLNGMTYGAYQSSYSLLNSSDWMNVFGQGPTPQQVYQYAGMDQAQVTAMLDAQPSHTNPGMTYGTQKQLEGALGNVSQKYFGTSDNPQILSMFQQAQQGK